MVQLTEIARKNLLQRARAAIARAIGAHAATPVVEPLPGPHALIPADFRAGAFVTLRKAGELRGCIGYPEPTLPLLDAVERCAVSAALADPRFPPLSAHEWTGVLLEISVLGPIEPVRDIEEVEVGRHGLVVEFGSRRGLLLPQVAIEWQWDAVEFVSQTCVKAGLPRDAWRNGARWYKFEAEVFGESD
jgi:AmmeMemoRadiSam system protein A